ncbi:MAG: hypothetical protein PHV78_01500 [Patescibacteria group bacterium]|nr:hypothetical protein [Patescibacteria group bacterium]MDD5121171.1 hypothetical protein [Patescibacteria group bacterium]MDD5222019.1 hypothetical protein [Patescibacteria group bacterium]MDD5395910.1 hypothetical protein [Patescibacteria group bacterium]
MPTTDSPAKEKLDVLQGALSLGVAVTYSPDAVAFITRMTLLVCSPAKEPIVTFQSEYGRIGIRIRSLSPLAASDERVLTLFGQLECHDGRKVRDVDPGNKTLARLARVALVFNKGVVEGTILAV